MKYMIIDYFNDCFIDEFDDYYKALVYYKDRLANRHYDEHIRLIEFRIIDEIGK